MIALDLAAASTSSYRDRFDRPVFIVSMPRSGSSLLFQTIAQAPGVQTIGGESHNLIESIAGLHPRVRGWTSNRLVADDATPALAEEFSRRFYEALRDRDGRPARGAVRMIEKTPKNSLRVPFLDRIYPDARYIFLYRDVRETLSSMIEAWTSGGFRTYPALPDWLKTPQSLPWSLLLVPGWRELAPLPLPEIVARQWAIATELLFDDLAAIAGDRVVALSHADFLADPQAALAALCESVDIGWDRQLAASLPLSPTVVSAPRPDKWRRNEAVISALLPIVAQADARARAVSTRLDVLAGR